MIVIGEKINATRKAVAAAIETGDDAFIRGLALEQVNAGADYLDVNGGHPTREAEVMDWLLDLVQETTPAPVSVDSSSPEVVRAALKRLARTKPLVNSITLERERMATYLDLVAEHECGVVALLMSDEGVPKGVDDRKRRAEQLVTALMDDAGKSPDEIYLDPAFLTLYTEERAGLDVLEALRWIRATWPEIHITGGLSNASYGLPKRRWINQAYLMMAMVHGMDSVIIDPTVEGTMALVRAAEVVLGRDPMGMAYMSAERDGSL